MRDSNPLLMVVGLRPISNEKYLTKTETQKIKYTGQQILRKFLLPENFWVVMMDHFKVNINMILDLLYHVRIFRNMKFKF